MSDEPVYGIMDPDYARFYSKARCVAKFRGYALTVHGSFSRDLDIVAVPWTAEASGAEKLVDHILHSTGMLSHHPMSVREHGRQVWTLQFPEFGDPRFIDFSVMPLQVADTEEKPNAKSTTTKMQHYYTEVPGIGNVALTRHSQDQATKAGFSDAMVSEALMTPDGADIPDSPGVVFRDRGILRLVIVLRPEPFRGASLVTTIIRKQPQAKVK